MEDLKVIMIIALFVLVVLVILVCSIATLYETISNKRKDRGKHYNRRDKN